MKIDKSIVTGFISKGETKNAIKYLLEVIDEKSSLYSSIINLSSRYNRLNKDLQKAVIDDDDFNIELNKINLALVDFGEEQMETPTLKKKKNFSKYIIGVLLLAIVCTGLWFAYAASKEPVKPPVKKVIVEDIKTKDPEPKAIAIPPMSLTINYSLNSFTGANLTIENNKNKTVLIKDLKVLWNYKKCTSFKDPISAAVMMVYNYKIELTKSKGEKIIDYKKFIYKNGEAEEFNIDIRYPNGKGIYNIGIGFEYKIIGSDTWYDYKTQKEFIEKCNK